MSEYLAIKNWRKYQGSYTRSYIRDYTEQDGDDKVCKLTFFQRQVLSGVRRIRGRLGKNVPNDATYIAQALHALPTDRPHVAHAIATLVSREFLSLTDQQVDESNTPIKRREKKREEEKRPPASATPRGALPEQGKVSKATRETRHHRVEQLVKGWYRDWVGVECPWDGGEAAQLSRMLKAWPNQPDQQFVTCLEHLARSDCIPKGDRPREWLGKLPKFIQGPLDQWWKPKGLSSNGNGTSKTEQRNASNRDAIIQGSQDYLHRTNAGAHGGTVRPGDHAGSHSVVAGGPQRPYPKPDS